MDDTSVGPDTNVSDLHSWLDGRRPAAPDDLRRRVQEAATAALRAEPEGVHRGSSPEERVELLLDRATHRLGVALDRPGRVRETAFELLVADALVTYACEAALETQEPAEALQRIVEVGRTR